MTPSSFLFFCAATFATSTMWADPPARIVYLEAAGEALKAGEEVPRVMWDAIRSESIDALSRKEIIARIDLTEITKSTARVFARNSIVDTSEELDAQLYVALLLGKGAAQQSGSGVNYRTAPDEIVIKPLLNLANSWLTMAESLKAKGADARAPRYSGGVKVLDGTPLTDDLKALIAEDARLRELAPLNSRLNVVNHHLGDLSRVIKSIVQRLKTAGKVGSVNEAISESKIGTKRFRQLIED